MSSKGRESEAEALRNALAANHLARKADARQGGNASGSVDKDHAQSKLDEEWEDVKRIVEELTREITDTARARPMLSLAGAFVLGLLLGRASAHRAS